MLQPKYELNLIPNCFVDKPQMQLIACDVFHSALALTRGCGICFWPDQHDFSKRDAAELASSMSRGVQKVKSMLARGETTKNENDKWLMGDVRRITQVEEFVEFCKGAGAGGFLVEVRIKR